MCAHRCKDVGIFFDICGSYVCIYRQVVTSPSIPAYENTTMTDAAFVARLQRKDPTAYDALVAQYGDALYGYLYHSTHDHQHSEALLSATFLRVVEQIDSYRAGDPPLVVWLHRIAHTVMRDRFTPPSP